MSNGQPSSHETENLPRAKIQKDWKRWLIWLVPLGAAALAGYFIYTEMLSSGPTIHISFADARGLEPGKSEVKYRGAQIGTLKTLQLSKDQQTVEATVSLDRSAADIAREGSRFWIVKAQIGLKQVQALGTIVSGDFITVEPGHGKQQTDFTGLAEEPIIESKGTIRAVLLSERLGAVKTRSPVFYRGVQVGQVFNCDLGPDSQTIHILVDMQPQYAPLLRMNSKFWNAGGIHVNIGLSGADISAQSAETLVAGGIDFATPDTTEKPAPSGTAFRLYDKPENDWLSWAPRIQLKQEKRPTTPEVTQTSR